MSSKIKYNKISGGLFIWCTFLQKIDIIDFCQKSIAEKVCIVPGNAFLVDEKDTSDSFRINFSTPSNKELELGIKILGNLINKL